MCLEALVDWREARFGEEAYPIRIRMADLPEGSRLIPNPYNQIPGFSIGHHHFLPGFRITSYNVCYTKLLRIASCTEDEDP